MNNKAIGFVNVFVKKYVRFIKYINHNLTFKPAYRIVNIIKDEEGSYILHIQIINTKLVFYTKPIDVLENDELIDKFCPRDVRTLTYYGYLTLHSPKFEIAARRILDNDNCVFAVKQKGNKQLIIKSAKELMNEENIITNMSAKDALKIGYSLANES